MREAMELHEATDQYFAQPLEDNIFEWHFTVRGAPDTDFANGRYHGRIILPPEYPMKPPSIILLTPNGRFEIGKKICLSMSAHHPETWQPSWSIRTVLLAIIGFMPSKGEGAIGALEYSREERKKLAKRSKVWICAICGSNNSTCLREGAGGNNAASMAESMRIAGQMNFQSAPEDTMEDPVIESNSPNGDGAVLNEADDTTTAPLAVTDRDDGAASVGTSDYGNNQVSSDDDNSGRAPDSIDGVRKRAIPTSHDAVAKERVKKTPVSKRAPNGLCTLILLWIVVLSLVILIFRRLCMDALLIGGSK